MTTVDQDSQLDPTRPAEVMNDPKRRPNRPAGEEDIVDEDNPSAPNVEREFRLPEHRRLEARVEIVPIQRDVDRADLGPSALICLDQISKALGERYSPSANSNQSEGNPLLGPINDFGGKAAQTATLRFRSWIDPWTRWHLSASWSR